MQAFWDSIWLFETVAVLSNNFLFGSNEEQFHGAQKAAQDLPKPVAVLSEQYTRTNLETGTNITSFLVILS